MSPSLVRALHHLAVVVRDLARAERFWIDVVGLPVLRRWDDAQGRPRSTWVALEGDSFLAIELAGSDSPMREDGAPGWHCVALRIGEHERETWRARLIAAGHPIERESPYTLYVRDPDRNLVGFSHFPVAATTSRGGPDAAT